MIYVVELRAQGEPRAWFAFDAADLARKQASLAGDASTLCIYYSDAEAVAAFEGADPRIADKAHWRARHALHAQLVALEVLADDC